MRYDALGVDDENDRVGDAVAGLPRRVVFVEHLEGADDFRARIGEQGKTDIALLGETRERRDFVIADGRDVVAEAGEFAQSSVPGDRLDFAGGSPVERTGEQQDEPAFPRQGSEFFFTPL